MGHLLDRIRIGTIDFSVDALQIDVLERKDTQPAENHSEREHDRYFWRSPVDGIRDQVAGNAQRNLEFDRRHDRTAGYADHRHDRRRNGYEANFHKQKSLSDHFLQNDLLPRRHPVAAEAQQRRQLDHERKGNPADHLPGHRDARSLHRDAIRAGA